MCIVYAVDLSCARVGFTRHCCGGSWSNLIHYLAFMFMEIIVCNRKVNFYVSTVTYNQQCIHISSCTETKLDLHFAGITSCTGTHALTHSRLGCYSQSNTLHCTLFTLCKYVCSAIRIINIICLCAACARLPVKCRCSCCPVLLIHNSALLSGSIPPPCGL